MRLQEFKSAFGENIWFVVSEDNEKFTFLSDYELNTIDKNEQYIIPSMEVSKMEEGLKLFIYRSKNSFISIDILDYNSFYDEGFFETTLYENSFKKETYIKKSLLIADYLVNLQIK